MEMVRLWEGDALPLEEAVLDPDTVGETLTLAPALELEDTDADADRLDDADTLTDEVGDIDFDAETLGEADCVADEVKDAD